VGKWVTFELDDDIHRRAKAAAALSGLGLYDYLEEKIAEGVERDERSRSEQERAPRPRRPPRPGE
jgi:hypothetical protein